MADRFKKILRKSLIETRRRLTPGYIARASSTVCQNIQSLEAFRHARRIALYQAANGEIDLSDLWKKAPYQGKFCYFPALNEDKTLSFLPATPVTSFKKNRFDIAEPDIDKNTAIAPEAIDVIFMPLVGFDTKGTRLGMGAGYYDRTFSQCKRPLLIGVAYDFQRLEYIEPQAWDIPMDAVITPDNLFWSSK